MKKFLFLTIGIISLLIGTTAARADECNSTLYASEFTCRSKGIYHYCALESKLTRQGPDFSIYESAYCDLIQNRDDEIYEAVAQQFKAEDKSMTAEKVKTILSEKIFASYDRVKVAYEREKMMSQSRASLKQKFRNSEIWYNGSLSDSPFDLVVDLNLIEIMIFGSRAEWNDDVWSWPKKDDSKEEKADTGIQKGQIPGSEADETATPSATDPSDISEEADEYECVPDADAISILEGKGVNTGDAKKTIPQTCGDGKIDEGEECDDGNNIAGDGCGEACAIEEGASLSCRDAEAVTFRQLSAVSDKKTEDKKDESDKHDETPPITCPPGSTVVPKPKTQAEKEARVKQSPNYPGPYVGGVFKEYPPSEKTNCPPGATYTEVNIAGETYHTCVSTEICASFEDVRQKLFGDDYKDDEEISQIAEAIEMAVCVEVKKIKRPESPYAVNEGCIDCHITAMNDIMAKMLEKNIAPLQNSMQSWGTSNRWGPTISFNINVLTRWILKPIVSWQYAKPMTDKEEADKAVSKTDHFDPNNPHAPATIPTIDQTGEVLLRQQIADEQEKAQQSEFLKNYTLAGDAGADQRFHAQIITKLRELQTSFASIQNIFMDISLAVKFAEKQKCTF